MARKMASPSLAQEKNATQTIRDHELLTLSDGAVLVFGLRWFPIVGSRVEVLARRKAYEARATHYVQGGINAIAVGCARLRPSRKTYYAAAQLFARIYPHGTVAGLLLLGETRTWLVAAQDGAVMTRTDRIYPNVTMATAALNELDLRHPGLAQGVQHLVLDDLIAALDTHAALWRLGLAWGRFSTPFRGGMWIIALGLALFSLWYMWRSHTPITQQKSVQIDPAEAWRDAVARAIQAVRLHQPDQLGCVFDKLKALPTVLHGWSLSAAHCRFQGQDWQCQARYVRTTPHATNAQFVAALPASVGVVFSNLEEAHTTWTVHSTVRALDPRLLASAAHTDQVLASLLQRLRPIFTHIALGIPIPLAVLPPRDAQGQALPAPRDLPRMRQRSIILAGPLRSFSLFTHPPATIAWSEVALNIVGTSVPTGGESPLMAQLQGIVYERE